MRRIATTLSALGFFWAAATTVYVLRGAGEAGAVASTRYTALENVGSAVGHITVPLVSTHGVWIVTLLAGITLLAGLPLGVALRHPPGQRTVTWTVGLLLLGFSWVAGFSVGLAYLPAATVLLLAAALSPGKGSTAS